ncbi:PleD family two-component system response regulator [Patescibacteria group bacterium]
MPKKILCIDDDPFYEALYRDILTTHGFQVRHAFDAAAGHKEFVKYKPDLVTLDVMMPERSGLMDGYGLLKTLRSDDDSREVPVIMISALGEEGDAKQALELGANDYLPKQKLTPDLLVAKIKKYLAE